MAENEGFNPNAFFFLFCLWQGEEKYPSINPQSSLQGRIEENSPLFSISLSALFPSPPRKFIFHALMVIMCCWGCEYMFYMLGFEVMRRKYARTRCYAKLMKNAFL